MTAREVDRLRRDLQAVERSMPTAKTPRSKKAKERHAARIRRRLEAHEQEMRNA